MPFRRKIRAPRFARRFRRRMAPRRRVRVGRKRMSRATTAIARAPTGYKDRQFVKLRYSTGITFTIEAGTGVITQFIGNGLSRPHVSDATWHSPYGFDQWALLYQMYRVHGSSCRVRPAFPDSSGTGAVTLVLAPFAAIDANTAYPSVPTGDYPLNEYPYVKYIQSSPYIASGSRGNQLKSYISVSKIIGIPKKAISDDMTFAAQTNIKGTQSSTNPAADSGGISRLFHWWIAALPAGATDSISFLVTVDIVYYVEFFSRRILPFSTGEE